jgi:hypothetical protein
MFGYGLMVRELQFRTKRTSLDEQAVVDKADGKARRVYLVPMI